MTASDAEEPVKLVPQPAGEFSYRYGDWVLFNTSAWKPGANIWMDVIGMPVKGQRGKSRPQLRLRWHCRDRRFHQDEALDKLTQLDPLGPVVLKALLEHHLYPAPAPSEREPDLKDGQIGRGRPKRKERDDDTPLPAERIAGAALTSIDLNDEIPF